MSANNDGAARMVSVGVGTAVLPSFALWRKTTAEHTQIECAVWAWNNIRQFDRHVNRKRVHVCFINTTTTTARSITAHVRCDAMLCAHHRLICALQYIIARPIQIENNCNISSSSSRGKNWSIGSARTRARSVPHNMMIAIAVHRKPRARVARCGCCASSTPTSARARQT